MLLLESGCLILCLLQTCKAQSSATPTCTLNCNSGTCKVVPGQGPKCICPPKLSGANCEHSRCSQFCKNKGTCFVDLLSFENSDIPAPLRCNCPAQWTGEHCEIPVHLCQGKCFNDGTCSTSATGQFMCICKPGFSGTLCQDCIDFECKNGGICMQNGSKSYCQCPANYNGNNCEISDCDNFCSNFGTCTLTPTGPRCNCRLGFSGPRCNQDACFQHCQNGGSCNIGLKQPECACPFPFTGRRCEVNLCKSQSPPNACAHLKFCDCQNNGSCEEYAGSDVCKCSDLWGGQKCEIYLGHDNPCINRCHNSGICQVKTAQSVPTCLCSNGWAGDQCEQPAACQFYCQHGGACSITDGIPYCRCTSEYEGVKCEHPKHGDVYVGEISSESGNVVLPTLLTVGVLLAIICTLAGIYFLMKRRRPFSHERLQENDFNNPIYQERDAEPFTLDADKVMTTQLVTRD